MTKQISSFKKIITNESIRPFLDKNENSLKGNSNYFRAFGKAYPNLKFSCPNCGMLDVMINFKNSDFILGQCLECKSNWNEEYNF